MGSGGGAVECQGTRMEAPMGVRSGRRTLYWYPPYWYPCPPLQWRWGLGPQKNFSALSFEMLNFYAFWTPEQGGSAATVIATMMLTSAHQCRLDRLLLLPIFYHCIIMLSNVASSLYSLIM